MISILLQHISRYFCFSFQERPGFSTRQIAGEKESSFPLSAAFVA
jgi:hypothetical protein